MDLKKKIIWLAKGWTETMNGKSKSSIFWGFFFKQWIGGHDKGMNNWDEEQQTNNGSRNS